MMEWWEGLSGVTQGFFMAAGVFSLLMLWQMIAALIGLAGAETDFDTGMDVATDADVDMDVHVDADADVGGMDHPEFEHGADVDGVATVASFRLLSIRSVLAFLTMFAWAGALYTMKGDPVSKALMASTLWGLGAMAVVALALYGLRRLAESGTPRIATCVGTTGTVYLDIPAQGMGEARVTVSGVATYVKARGVDGAELKAGTPIRVTRVLGPRAIEVKAD